MRTRTTNLGILAHVDAGKTSLTERLLLHAGVIAELGSVDAGSTRTDTLALERARGITIKAAVVSFELADPLAPGASLTVNLVDTPGHSDFIAEVERSLAVLDGAVLVVSAVEGVQAQTRVLWRALRRLRIPTVLFVNKIDRAGACTDAVLRQVTDRLGVTPVPLSRAVDEGTRVASVVPDGLAALGLARDDRSGAPGDRSLTERLVEALSDVDDALVADWLDRPGAVDAARLRAALDAQTAAGRACPLLVGSAITGAGVEDLAAALPRLLPASTPDADAALAGTVFAVQRGPAGEKVALVDVTSGSLAVRDRVLVHDGRALEAGRSVAPAEQRVTGLDVHVDGGVRRTGRVPAGRIARVVGLERARIGDLVGDARIARPLVHEFSPPTLETVVEPADASDPGARSALHTALTRLAEQDPLIDLRHDELRGETHVSLYGEVQKEVIGATLEAEHGVVATFSTTSVICRERVVGSGAAHELIGVAPNPFLATVGLRIDPAPAGTGVRFALEVELGSMPPAFFTAVEETVHATLGQGLRGWPVTDCVVTMTHSGYWPRQSHMHQKFDKSMSSTAGDFRTLTPLVLMVALRRAGTTVEEPFHRFDLEVPSEVIGATLTMFAHVRATPDETTVLGPVTRLRGEVPAESLHELQQRVPGLTSGLGDLATVFDGYRPVTGAPPGRSRTDHDPLHRREYLLRVAGKL
ncbi:translation factor GTPase family protein [Intrasporangium sp. YIM S08009]|uniref:translation factor GTPase family protein n=1 Tax=Intrasporangium zincisolvens TaxID=3080018 RepID=UPI002B0609FF|nr:translation factor GTPase family protein [Intrasporangium sp. YIM S08009]